MKFTNIILSLVVAAGATSAFAHSHHDLKRVNMVDEQANENILVRRDEKDAKEKTPEEAAKEVGESLKELTEKFKESKFGKKVTEGIEIVTEYFGTIFKKDSKKPPSKGPKKEAPKKEAPKKEAPKKEAPKKEAPKKEAPKEEASEE